MSFQSKCRYLLKINLVNSLIVLGGTDELLTGRETHRVGRNKITSTGNPGFRFRIAEHRCYKMAGQNSPTEIPITELPLPQLQQLSQSLEQVVPTP